MKNIVFCTERELQQKIDEGEVNPNYGMPISTSLNGDKNFFYTEKNCRGTRLDQIDGTITHSRQFEAAVGEGFMQKIAENSSVAKKPASKEIYNMGFVRNTTPDSMPAKLSNNLFRFHI